MKDKGGHEFVWEMGLLVVATKEIQGHVSNQERRDGSPWKSLLKKSSEQRYKDQKVQASSVNSQIYTILPRCVLWTMCYYNLGGF